MKKIKTLADLKKFSLIPPNERSQQIILGYINTDNINLYLSGNYLSIENKKIIISKDETINYIFESKGLVRLKKIKSLDDYKKMDELQIKIDKIISSNKKS